MAYTVSELVKDLLVAQGAGTFASFAADTWGIYLDILPDMPDRVISLEDSPSGPNYILDQVSSDAGNYGGVHITLRGRTQAEVFTKAQTVKTLIRTYPNLASSAMSATGGRVINEAKLGLDAQGRFQYTLNATYYWKNL